jgi:hypothetical protein
MSAQQHPKNGRPSGRPALRLSRRHASLPGVAYYPSGAALASNM